MWETLRALDGDKSGSLAKLAELFSKKH